MLTASQLGDISLISLATSVIISAMGHHLKGHGDPPKVNLREMRPMSSMTVEQAAALWPQSVSRLYAALKSYFPMRIALSG